ncbi:SPW repeat domain-containing protein [Streptomyces sp. DW26H14]|uniref:SPW repeat domain-containing protein n=1 Tax=Streptomyces sp. DW26H14 TaxID=3435395 RepID=UPI00403DC26D
MAAHTSPGTTSSTSDSIDQHPDIMALRRDHSERAASTPMAQAVEGLAILAGLYLAGSAWIIGFTAFTPLAITNLIAGLAFALLAMGYANSAYERMHGMSWAALGIGVWAIIAPWVITGSFATMHTIWSNCVIGGVMVLLSLMTAALGAGRSRARGRSRQT